MRRRRLLAVLTAAGGASLAGCSERVSIGSGSSSDASVRSPASPSVSATEAGSTEPCPAVGPSAVCYGDASSNGPIVLVPSTDSVSIAGEFIGFTLHNRSESEISFRPYGWQVWRRLDRWTRIEKASAGEAAGETVLSSGGSYGWQVAVGPVSAEADRPPVTVNDVEFEPGRYAFAVPGRGSEKHTYVAAFDVTG